MNNDEVSSNVNMLISAVVAKTQAVVI
jgi:hypothetical protein